MSAPAPAAPLGLGRLLVAWLAGVVVLQVLATVVSMVGVQLLREAPLQVLGVVLAVLGVLVGLVGVTVAVVVLAAGRAAGRPWWHWLVAAIPVLLISQVLGLVVQVATLGRLVGDVWTVAVALVELVLAAGLAVGVGAVLRRSAEARTAPAATASAH